MSVVFSTHIYLPCGCSVALLENWSFQLAGQVLCSLLYSRPPHARNIQRLLAVFHSSRTSWVVFLRLHIGSEICETT